jgi:hypothetical protein
MVKVLIRWEELTNVNIYAPSTLAPTDISQILLGLKRKRDFNTKKSWRQQQSSFMNGQIIWKNKQKVRVILYCRTNWPNIYSLNILSNSSGIHILVIDIGDIL